MKWHVEEQQEFRPTLPVVIGNADYRRFRDRLDRVDELLRLSGLEESFVENGIEQWLHDRKDVAQKQGVSFRQPSNTMIAKHQRILRQALRCTLAREFTQTQYRVFARELAATPLLQRFCLIDRLDCVKVPAKSSLERFDKLVPESRIRAFVDMLNRKAIEDAETLELAQSLALDAYFSDTTCVEANIHFPTDWILLRDAIRTLIKAVLLIRKHGLNHRMPKPEGFLSQINTMCIQMSQSRRRQDGAKSRKAILRKMKRLANTVKEHANRYNHLLQARWRETDLGEGQMKRIVRGIDAVVEQLPKAIWQAHERIIGERQVKNADKLLSIYEKDVHVIVRNKPNAEVEFGNKLMLAELASGLIADWKLERNIDSGDTAMLSPSLERIKTVFGRFPSVVGTDRGFACKANHQYLEQNKIVDAICPKDPRELQQKMTDPLFRRTQKRRAQTEGRIGILKNVFLEQPMRSKGFAHRETALAWAVLAHNLWLLAGKERRQHKVLKKAA
jgi:IS5 family transposase